MNNKASGFGPAILSHSGLDNIYVESTGCNNTADSKGLPCDGVLLAQDGIDVCESFKTICKAPPSPFPSSPPPQMALELSLLSQEPSSRPTSVSTTPGPSTEPSTGPSTEPSTEPSAVRSSPIDSVTPYPDQSALNSSPDIFSSDATSTLSPRSEAPTVVLESFEGGANSGPTNVATDMLSGTAMPTSSSVVFTQKPSIDVSSLLSNAESLSGAQQDSDFSTSEQPSSTPEPYLSTSQPSTVSYAASAEPKQTNTPIDAALDESLAMVPTFSPTQDNSSSFCPPLREPAVLSVGSYLQSSANVFVSSVTDIRMCGSILKNGSKGGWFSLLGSGEVVTASTCSLFANHVFDGDTQLLIFSADADDTKCFDGLHCVAANDDYCGKQSLISWYAQANKQYFIYVHVKSTGSIGSQFSLTLAPTPGGSCRASFELAPSPGTGSLEMNDYPSEIDFLSLGGGRWRSVTGTGDWMTASNCRGENEGEGSKMKILQGSCDNLIQTQVVETNCGIAGHSLTWLSEAGKRYFILEYDEDLDSVFRE